MCSSTGGKDTESAVQSPSSPSSSYSGYVSVGKTGRNIGIRTGIRIGRGRGRGRGFKKDTIQWDMIE